MWLVAVIILVQDVKESKLETHCFCGLWREQSVICSLCEKLNSQPSVTTVFIGAAPFGGDAVGSFWEMGLFMGPLPRS